MEKKIKHIHIFLAFFRVGILGYGGGPSSIPLVYKEVVDHYHWVDADEFGDILAIGNTLPGPIATKMAAYIGYRIAGIQGMFNALLATILPSIVLMILLLTYLKSFKDQPWVQGMANAVVPVVGVMMAVLTWEFFAKSKTGLGWPKSLILLFLSLVLIGFLNLHPGILIASLLIISLLTPGRKNGEIKEGDNDLLAGISGFLYSRHRRLRGRALIHPPGRI
jgi:chromate transporter